MVMVVDKLIDFSSSKDEELRDIAGLGAFFLIAIMLVLNVVSLSFEDDHGRTPSRGQNCRQSMREANSKTARSACKCKL